VKAGSALPFLCALCLFVAKSVLIPVHQWIISPEAEKRKKVKKSVDATAGFCLSKQRNA
jgi:hypothetical protein